MESLELKTAKLFSAYSNDDDLLEENEDTEEKKKGLTEDDDSAYELGEDDLDEEPVEYPNEEDDIE